MSFDKFKKEERNILLAQAIKKYQVLYDQHSPSYTNRLEQDKAWQAVARETSESVLNCKENWRSLRNSFVRDLRLPSVSNSNAKRKSYYMSEHLQFLVPFLPSKQRQNHAARTSGLADLTYGPEDTTGGQANNSDILTYVSDFEHYQDSSHPIDSTDEEIEGTGSTYSNNNTCNLEDSFDDNEPISRRKRTKSATTSSDNLPPSALNDRYHSRDTRIPIANQVNSTMEFDHDFDFLRSLLPDFKKLPDRSKMTFKLKTLQLLNELIYSEDPVTSSVSSDILNVKQEEYL